MDAGDTYNGSGARQSTRHCRRQPQYNTAAVRALQEADARGVQMTSRGEITVGLPPSHVNRLHSGLKRGAVHRWKSRKRRPHYKVITVARGLQGERKDMVE